MKKEDGTDTVQVIKDGKVTTVDQDVHHHIPFRTVAYHSWQPQEQVLAVPDLGDTLEAWEARQRAGVTSYINTVGERVYPMDPSTYQTAKDVVKRQVDDLTKRIALAQAQLAKDKEEDEKRKDDLKKEKTLFEEFKQTKNESKKG